MLYAILGNSQKFHFSLYYVSRGLMALFASVHVSATRCVCSVHVSATKKTIVPWSVVSLDLTQTFRELFRPVQAGKYAVVKTSTELAAAVLRDSSGTQRECW